MVDFRRLIPALAVLALLFVGLVPMANAQSFNCSGFAVNPSLRAQGMTELTGDIVVNCTGGDHVFDPALVKTANIQVFLNTTVTSRLVSSSSGLSDALLLIDDPATGDQVLGSTTVAGNVYQGTVSGNSVQFLGVPINPPGTTQSLRTFRITNVRGNANAIAQNSQITALVITTGSTSLPIPNPLFTVGTVQSGLTFSLLKSDEETALTSGKTIQQCVSTGNALAGYLRFTEPANFASSFKLRGDSSQTTPGSIYNTETGLISGVAGNTPADTGTRLKAVFSNVPAGVSIYVSTRNWITGVESTDANTMAVAVAGEIGTSTPLAASGFPDGTAANVVNVPVVSGSATAVWEVTGANALAAQNYDFQVYYLATADTANNSPAIGAATVLGSFAPTPPAFSATSGATAQPPSGYPIPRFAASTSSPSPAATVTTCSTNLLFPFVTNKSGFDTGLAISNTTSDPFGTGAQAGTCTWNFYGDSAPAALTGPSVASGSYTTALISTVAPNFQGYIIAVCNFQYAHGFAYVSDIGARNIAMGYLALIIPQGRGVNGNGDEALEN